MDRILELVKDVPEVSVESAHWLIAHAGRVDQVSLKVSRMSSDCSTILTCLGCLYTTRHPRDICLHSTIHISISKRAVTKPRGLFHIVRHDLFGSGDGSHPVVHGDHVSDRWRYTQHVCTEIPHERSELERRLLQ